jgi:hypothetical protein
MLFVPEGKMGKALEPSKKQRSFGNQQELHRKLLSLVFLFKVSVEQILIYCV